ncbi:GreA/GreB family elongation factor [soil metagenome]
MILRRVNKQALKTELIAQLEMALTTARAAHAAAIEGSTHEEAKPENDKDTRGLEQSYLARGQAQRVAELEAAIGDVTALALRSFGPTTAIAMSALVAVEEDGVELELFIAPAGGGNIVGKHVPVVTPNSPLGRALLGKKTGDDIELQLPGKLRGFVVVTIS